LSTLNLIKLCVGVSSVQDLVRFRKERAAEAEARGETYTPCHVTRMRPRRAEDLLNGGSLYWVIKGQILVRQEILSLEERIGNDGIRRCGIVMSPALIRTRAAPRRPFQGWRYLEQGDCPPDLRENVTDDDLPESMSLALSEIGLR